MGGELPDYGASASASSRRRGGTGVLAIAAACACGLARAGQWSSGRSSAFLARPAHAAPLIGQIEELAQRSPGQSVLTLRTHGEAQPGGVWAGVAATLGLTGLVCAGAAIVRRPTTAQRWQGQVTAADLGRSRGQGAATATRAMLTSIVDEEEDQEEEQEEVAAPTEPAALVKKTSVLVVGATGTLGRQVVRQLLNAGYSVRCMLRPKADRPFSFLSDWGAMVVEGSLARPETLPTALVGIHTVVDCAAARPEESIYQIDWEGKKNFIQCCEQMGVQRYMFMSIQDCDKHTNVPLMQIKYLTEKFLEKSKLRYTVLRHSGFYQPLISQYAVSVLDDQKVWGDDGSSPGIAYIDSQDCARMLVAAMSKERTIGKTLTVSGPKVWSTTEVIELCEKLSGRKADVNSVSSVFLKLTQVVAGCFDWSIDIAERLRFVEVNQKAKSSTSDVMNEDTYNLIGVDSASTRTLDEYIGEYYRRVFKKLTKGKFEPEAAELEQLKAEEESKLQKALRKDTADVLSLGQTPERDVTILEQRSAAERLTRIFERQQTSKEESVENSWFGITPISELVNGRSAMMGFSLGLFTEWATDISVSKQVDELIAIFSPPS